MKHINAYKMCKSKQRYRTYNDAMKKIKACKKHDAGYLRAYECPVCGGWHITSRKEE